MYIETDVVAKTASDDAATITPKTVKWADQRGSTLFGDIRGGAHVHARGAIDCGDNGGPHNPPETVENSDDDVNESDSSDDPLLDNFDSDSGGSSTGGCAT